MKKYTFQIIIEESSDEYWESVKGNGCAEIEECLVDALNSVFPTNYDLKLVKFENK